MKKLEKLINTKDNTSIEFPALEFYSLTEETLDDAESFIIKIYNALTPETELTQGDEE